MTQFPYFKKPTLYTTQGISFYTANTVILGPFNAEEMEPLDLGEAVEVKPEFIEWMNRLKNNKIVDLPDPDWYTLDEGDSK